MHEDTHTNMEEERGNFLNLILLYCVLFLSKITSFLLEKEEEEVK